jgi:histidinol-phosphate phosphatase family protein
VVVVPTIGRAHLQTCLSALAASVARAGYLPRHIVLADDRRDTPDPLPVVVPPAFADRTTVVTLEGRGPAAARNAGWRAAPPSDWVVFLDDDVRVTADWARLLAADLADAAPDTGGVQGVIDVPWPPDQAALLDHAGLPDHSPPPDQAARNGRSQRPADSQRATLGLAGARWITADMAYRRSALADTGGFDERFPRAYREDADLALRVLDRGWSLQRGRRVTTHPVPPPRPWASLRAQAGNADDAAMRHQHGPDWRRRAGVPAGRRGWHAVACGLSAFALAGAGLGTGTGMARTAAGTAARRTAAVCAGAWLGLTAEFAARRILAGPRTPREITDMAVTSVVIPPLAVWHWLRGTARHRHAGPWPPRPRAVLFDRDGTLVHDVPYNGDPEKVVPVPGALAAIMALRRAGLRVGLITNQSGIGSGTLTREQVDAVNERVGKLVGPLDTVAVCPHRADEGCGCRKPAPGLIIAAADALGLTPAECAVIGDIGSDIEAGRAAGARAVLVPNDATADAELAGVPRADSVGEAVTALLSGRILPSWPHQGGTS